MQKQFIFFKFRPKTVSIAMPNRTEIFLKYFHFPRKCRNFLIHREFFFQKRRRKKRNSTKIIENHCIACCLLASTLKKRKDQTLASSTNTRSFLPWDRPPTKAISCLQLSSLHESLSINYQRTRPFFDLLKNPVLFLFAKIWLSPKMYLKVSNFSPLNSNPQGFRNGSTHILSKPFWSMTKI